MTTNEFFVNHSVLIANVNSFYPRLTESTQFLSSSHKSLCQGYHTMCTDQVRLGAGRLPSTLQLTLTLSPGSPDTGTWPSSGPLGMADTENTALLQIMGLSSVEGIVQN